MELLNVHHPLVFVFGILGNVISTGVYFAPMPTFIEIYKRKSTMGFQSLPYVVSLFSALLWLFYALINGSNTFLLISINTFGTIIESIYIIIFLVYATPDAKKKTFTALTIVMVFFFAIFLVTLLWVNEHVRVQVVGWICVVVSVCVFAAPLSIVLQVVRTKSVEFMPLSLSCFLTLSAIMWFGYGMYIEDRCVMVPNILGFVLGVCQMGLYGYYRKPSTQQEKKPYAKEQHIINISILSNSGVHPVDSGRTSEAEDETKSCDHNDMVEMKEEKDKVKDVTDTGVVVVMCEV
ncbi:bidirectional sugar transporter N3-like [Rutidosis leptorrhynchoides]|uniref:bidirectional sugar transporter N3-like n=1 Tax=Rutidosis leptorrhynchoides TaxID=125765 RepID=UPI003A9A1C7A